MLMTVVAGIFLIITRLGMAGNAARPVITVKPEISVMLKGCRFPCSGFMAIRTVCLRNTMHIILWLVRFMARYALLN